MKKTGIILFFLSYFFISLNCDLSGQQLYDCTIGEDYKLPSRSNISRLFAYDENFYYSLRLNKKGSLTYNAKGSGVYVEKFDKNLNHLFSIEINLPQLNNIRKLIPKQFFVANNNFVIFANQYDINNKKAQCFILLFDKNGEIIGKPEFLGEIIDISKKDFDESDYFTCQKFKTDNGLCFLYKQTFPPGWEVITKINYKLFDSNLNKIWEKQILIPYNPWHYEILNIVMNRSEDLFFIAKIKSENEFDKHFYNLGVFNQDSDEIQYYNFKLKNKEITKIKLDVTQNGNVYAFGFYKEQGTKKEIAGLYYYIFDSQKRNVIINSVKEISNDIISQFKNSDFEHLEPVELYLSENNQVIFISAFEWTKKEFFSDSEGKLYIHNIYNSGDIIVWDFDIEDNYILSQIIYKHQKSNHYPNEIGFESALAGNNMFFLFNDNPKNIDVYDNDKIKLMKKNHVLTLAAINLENGEYYKQKIICEKNRKNKLYFRPDFCYKQGDNSIIIIGESPDFYLSKIDFN